MKYAPQIQKLVDQAESQRKRRRAKARSAPVLVGSRRWTEAKRGRESRGRDRTRLELLRYNLRKAREQSRRDAAELRARGRASRPALRAAIKAFRAKWRAWVNAQVAELRRKHRQVWRTRLDATKLAVARAEFELKAERGYQREARAAAGAARAAKRAQPKLRSTGRLHAAESDVYVEHNLPSELVPVWRAMKRRVRTAGKYRSREEAFLEWCHDNPDEVRAIRASQAHRGERELARELEEQERRHYERQAG